MIAPAYPTQRPSRFAAGTIPAAAGANLTFIDLPGSFVVGDILDSVIDPGGSGNFTTYFYGTVMSDSGTPAMQQNQGLPAGVQGKNFVAIGRAK